MNRDPDWGARPEGTKGLTILFPFPPFRSTALFLSRRLCCNHVLKKKRPRKKEPGGPRSMLCGLFTYCSRTAPWSQSCLARNDCCVSLVSKCRPFPENPRPAVGPFLAVSQNTRSVIIRPERENSRRVMIHADTFNYSAVYRVCASNVSLLYIYTRC